MPRTSLTLPAPRGPIAVTTSEIPEPPPGHVLVEMEACGLCHSDLFVAGLEKLPRSPLILGHEGIGRVVAGEGFAAGDRVGITFLGSTCGECEPCRGGRERYCARQSNCGFSVDGALSTHAVVPSQHLVRVPAPLDASEAAPLCCAGWTAYAAVREAALPAGRTLAIFGLGGLGHLAIQYARHRGLRVAAVDPVEEKLDQARSLGADVAATVLRKEHGLADAALVLTANPAAIQQAFRSLQRTSTLILVGLATANFELPLVEAVLKGIRIHTSYLGTREDLEEVFRLPIRPHVTTHAIEEAPALLDRLARGQVKGRAVIRF